ncbi:MAG: hypothetical protein QOG67_2091 [Verrucomicrobiota bacterium]|jgi:hypothetical protein
MKPPQAVTLLLFLAGAVSLRADLRTSANYSIATETSDIAGNHATSANYSGDGSAGRITGLQTASGETSKNGYIGQLYEITGLLLSAQSNPVNEGATDQLSASQSLDDTTFLNIAATSVSWSVLNGPLSGVDVNGLATAATVYQDTLATAQGVFGFTATMPLTVKNVNTDDFGSYAGDGIDDAWQVQYFGQPPNALAGPNADADGTGQTNLFKYVAGLNPLDGSRFLLRIANVGGQPGQKNLIFSPRLVDRIYTPKAKLSLTSGTFAPLPNSSFSDNGQERTVTDFDGSGAAKFYEVEITKP